MNSGSKATQRISKFAPVAEIFRKIDALAAAVKPQEIALDATLGHVLAADVTAPASLPLQSLALRDGWAVRSELVADAGPYTPVPLVQQTPWVEAGEPLPAGTDAVLAPDAVTISGQNAEALASIAPGEGVLPGSGDIKTGGLLRMSGAYLRAADLAVLRLAGIKKISTRRPKILIVPANARIDRDPVTQFATRTIDVSGGIAQVDSRSSLDVALEDKNSDALIIVGGSGAGRNDKSVLALARVGRVELHGMGIQPGETAALGAVGTRPVLIVPGRFDAALSVLLIVGSRLFARLSGRVEDGLNIPVKLARKIASQVGIAEFVPVERTLEGAVPLASGQLPLSALARADGWILVPAESEGYVAGTTVEMRPLP